MNKTTRGAVKKIDPSRNTPSRTHGIQVCSLLFPSFLQAKTTAKTSNRAKKA